MSELSFSEAQFEIKPKLTRCEILLAQLNHALGKIRRI